MVELPSGGRILRDINDSGPSERSQWSVGTMVYPGVSGDGQKQKR